MYGAIAAGAQGASEGIPGASANKPWNGSGMDLNNAQRILDPVGIGGGGGMNKNAAEAFFDPAGIDSSSVGLHLFGKSNQPQGSQIPSVLPNLGANTLIPHAPQGRFMPVQTGGGTFNNMANQGAGPLFNPAARPVQQTPTTALAPTFMPSSSTATLGNGLMPAGGGSTGSPFLNLTWAPDTWTGAPMAINGNLYGWKNNGQVSSMGIIPEGGGLTNSTVFQSMTPGGRARR